MKQYLFILSFLVPLFAYPQSNTSLLDHYKEYYNQMRTQGDVQGVINALTHLNILSPNQARKDTLAVLYMNEGKHIQALNTIGIDKNENDSDMAVEVKAMSLQVLNQIERSVEHYEELYRRKPSPVVAYELADMKIQLDDLLGATKHITFGIANSKSDVMRTFYESQNQYQVPMKAAFMYLKGLVRFKENKSLNIDSAIEIMDEALAIAPNFNLALISKDALLSQKTIQ
jgi:tetratricopeptide (TPR) repeat protein|tara:strand:- start:2978 stop:3664 length:687 start_codon:yes stop_codon:yes gene_type:complete